LNQEALTIPNEFKENESSIKKSIDVGINTFDLKKTSSILFLQFSINSIYFNDIHSWPLIKYNSVISRRESSLNDSDCQLVWNKKRIFEIEF
jgi:hypothetical protein